MSSVMEKWMHWARHLPPWLVMALATLGGLGRLPAPGTFGAAAGLVVNLIVVHLIPAPVYLLLLALVTFLAVGIGDAASARLGERDPGSIVLDEAVGQAWVFLPFSLGLSVNAFVDALAAWGGLSTMGGRWAFAGMGFALFRLFDILKPFGIRRLERLPGGWGIVADDLAAAIAGAVVMTLAAVLMVPSVFG